MVNFVWSFEIDSKCRPLRRLYYNLLLIRRAANLGHGSGTAE